MKCQRCEKEIFPSDDNNALFILLIHSLEKILHLYTCNVCASLPNIWQYFTTEQLTIGLLADVYPKAYLKFHYNQNADKYNAIFHQNCKKELQRRGEIE